MMKFKQFLLEMPHINIPGEFSIDLELEMINKSIIEEYPQLAKLDQEIYNLEDQEQDSTFLKQKKNRLSVKPFLKKLREKITDWVEQSIATGTSLIIYKNNKKIEINKIQLTKLLIKISPKSEFNSFYNYISIFFRDSQGNIDSRLETQYWNPLEQFILDEIKKLEVVE